MLTMRAGNTLILGLDKINVERLKEGEPIMVPPENTGLIGPVCIIYGDTLQDIVVGMKEAGFTFPPGIEPI